MIWLLSVVGYCFVAVLVGIYFYRNCNDTGTFTNSYSRNVNHIRAAFWGGMFWFFGIWVMSAMMLIHFLEDNDVAQEAKNITFDDLCKQMKLDKLDRCETAECLLAFWVWLYKNQEFSFIGVSGT